MKHEHEYHEGPKAARKFDRTMKALFKAPKTVRVGKAAKSKKAGPSRKSSQKGKGA